MRASWLGWLLGVVVLAGCGGETPEPEVTPGPSPVVGTWTMDREALLDSFLQMALKELEEARASGVVVEEAYLSLAGQIREEANQKFGQMHATFVFAENGTFEADGSSGTASGTWTVQGRELAIEIREQDGAKLFEPLTWDARFEDGVITLKPEADKDYVMTLRR